MNTLAKTPNTTSLARADEWKLLVVTSWMPLSPVGAYPAFLENLGADFFYQLLEAKLRAEGVNIKERFSAHGGSAMTLHRACALFDVQDVGAATRVIAPILKATDARKFFVIGYFDRREKIWRPVWPVNTTFDLEAHMLALMDYLAEWAKKIQADTDAFQREMQALIPPENPS